MVKRYQLSITICLLFAMLLSGLQCDGIFYSLPLSFEIPDTLVAAERSVNEYNLAYTGFEKQDYWSAGNATRVSSSYLEKLQNRRKFYHRRNIMLAGLSIVFKVVLFSVVMVLFATGTTGISVPFRCLLYYIHNQDGKKRNGYSITF